LALSCQRLIDLAKEDGGRDNITVVLASFDAQA
jgi:serine/threonine protein phosphatase PrpC